MICNKVLIALTALLAVAAAIPFFRIDPEYAGDFENEYEENPELWGNAPLKHRANLKWGEWGNPNEQAGGSDVESEAPEVESDVESEVESEVESVADQAAAGGGSSGIQDPAGGGAIGGPGGDSNAVADAGANVGTGTNAAGQAVVAAEEQAGAYSVHAAGGPPPGQLMAQDSRGKGFGIAVGICVLVIAIATVAVFAIRHYWRHRL